MRSSGASRWWWLVFGVPAFVGPAAIHRAALAATHDADFELSARLYERAARGYRRDLDVGALARLRVHQLMDRCLATPTNAEDALAEAERRLARLDMIESLAPPFEAVPANTLWTAWSNGAFEPGVRAA